MKFLHTSDWHLGRTLYGRRRHREFEEFLGWLIQTLDREGIDALLIAGDIFDTTTPGSRVQELYYRFLSEVSATSCRHVIIIAGNHDSPSLLDAPKDILRFLNIHVVGTKKEAEEVILLEQRGETEAIVCAVPYLRDRDIRSVDAGETIEEKERKLVAGIRDHYSRVATIAGEYHLKVPVVAMGHLFTAGGRNVDGDGVRELYVGSLAHVSADLFPDEVDYYAFGHLHLPQKVGRREHIRYSGSPIPMGFGESRQQKEVVIIEFADGERSIQSLPVPLFRKLIRIEGNLDEIVAAIENLKGAGESGWLEVEYTGSNVVGNLRETVEEALSGTSLEVVRIKNSQVVNAVMASSHQGETLDELSPEDVFERCLEENGIPPEESADLKAAFDEILRLVNEEDRQDI